MGGPIREEYDHLCIALPADQNGVFFEIQSLRLHMMVNTLWRYWVTTERSGNPRKAQTRMICVWTDVWANALEKRLRIKKWNKSTSSLFSLNKVHEAKRKWIESPKTETSFAINHQEPTILTKIWERLAFYCEKSTCFWRTDLQSVHSGNSITPEVNGLTKPAVS